MKEKLVKIYLAYHTHSCDVIQMFRNARSQVTYVDIPNKKCALSIGGVSTVKIETWDLHQNVHNRIGYAWV